MFSRKRTDSEVLGEVSKEIVGSVVYLNGEKSYSHAAVLSGGR